MEKKKYSRSVFYFRENNRLRKYFRFVFIYEKNNAL